MEDDTLRFFQHLHSIEQESWIADRFHAELPRILSLVGGHRSPQTCLLADAGDYFVRILQVLSYFAETVVNCDLADHLNSRASALVDEADLTTIGYLDDKHTALRYVWQLVFRSDLLTCLSEKSQIICRPLLTVVMQFGTKAVLLHRTRILPPLAKTLICSKARCLRSLTSKLQAKASQYQYQWLLFLPSPRHGRSPKIKSRERNHQYRSGRWSQQHTESFGTAQNAR